MSLEVRELGAGLEPTALSLAQTESIARPLEYRPGGVRDV